MRRADSSPTRRSPTAIAVLLGILLARPAAADDRDALGAATIRIDAGRATGEISPRLYGQFLEHMFGGIKGGLHAELLRDRGFEEPPGAIGLPRDWERYPDDRNDDYGIAFRWDDSVSYPGRAGGEGGAAGHALRVDAGDGVLPRHGLYQARVPVREGVEYRGHLWLKTTGYDGRVVVALEPDVLGGETYAEGRIEGIRGGWRRYEFRLRPRRSDPLARFAILFEGRGRAWIDQASLMPGDAIGGVRRDVFDRVRALRPAFVRWPGGNVAQDYHWRWAVGPRDERVTWANLSWRNEPEPGDFGTDEFVALCRGVGAEPSITVNVEGRGATVEEASAWVEYCNGPATSRQGAARAANGHPEPYGIKLWEIGNEVWGDWVRGHSDAATYARNLRRYAEAMRAVDPTIELIAVGDNDLEWDREVLRAAGDVIDYLAVHHYYGRKEMAGDRLNLMARPLAYERSYRRLGDLLRELAPGRRVRLAINEWGLDLPEARQYSMDAALYGARLMNVFERSGGLVAMSAVSDLVNGWPGGIIQAGRHGLFVTPIYLVNRLYAAHPGKVRLEAEVACPAFDSSREGRGVPYLDAVASRSGDGRRILLKVVNADHSRPIAATVEVAGAEVAARAGIETVLASSPGATNGFATPEAISAVRSEFEAGRRFVVELPPASVSAITLEVSPVRD